MREKANIGTCSCIFREPLKIRKISFFLASAGFDMLFRTVTTIINKFVLVR